MQLTKQYLKRLAACGLALFLSVSVFMGPETELTVSAHSGRTDSYGGHHDYKNKSGLGSYHYHHGYPAHLHDGGVCPYETTVPVTPELTEVQPITPLPAPVDIQPVIPQPDLITIQPVVPQPELTIQPTVPQPDSATQPALSSVDYTPVFDAAFYAAANPDVAALYGTDTALLLQHFLTAGMQEGRQGNAAFNVWTYRDANPELAAMFGDNLPQYYTYYCLTNG
mgnify:FL=1